jgi:glutamate N-acetyltransferase/amino-acid N-acetyltransferase
MSTSVADQFTVVAATGGATAPKGFAAAGLHCGIKAKAGALDLGILAADTAVPAAGIFTTNLAQAAPITVSKRHLETNQGLGPRDRREQRLRQRLHRHGGHERCRPDGGGNCRATRLPAQSSAGGLHRRHRREPQDGQAGARDPRRGIGARPRQRGHPGARIMTTDPFPKEHAVTVKTARGTFTVGGTAKGSGMIEPNMATMLGFLATDAKVSSALLQRALRESAAGTFNAITVDGDGSTNDCVFALAVGCERRRD